MINKIIRPLACALTNMNLSPSSINQLKSLLFVMLGVFFAQTKSFPQVAGIGGKKPLVTTASNIDYGKPKEYVLGGVTVSGARFLDPNALISIAGFEVGKKIKIPSEQISGAIKKLWKQGFLGDVKISITKIESDQVFLDIWLQERPRLSRFTFTGVPSGQKQTLTDKITLIRGRIVTDPLIKNTKKSISKYYTDKGFKNVAVNITQQRDTVLSNSVILNIDVDKKSKAKIDEIAFSGVESVKASKLRRKMKKTKQVSFHSFITGSKFIDLEYQKDKENVIKYYNKLGYRNAAISEDTVYDAKKNRVKIVMNVSEGNKFYYRNIQWTGNYIHKKELLDQVLGIKKGDVYNPQELTKKLNYNPAGDDITSLYMDDGYLFFNIEPVEVKVDTDSIDIEMRIFEGIQATVNKVTVSGNTKTNDHVIYRELRVIPGQKFSRSDIIRTQRELSQLGYFDPEKINIDTKPNMADGTVDIGFGLEEKSNDQIELSGGWGGNIGFIGTLGLSFNNFSARNITNFSRWNPLPAGDGQRTSIRFQANGKSYQNYSISFMEPWLGGKKPNSFSINMNHSVMRELAYNSGAFNFKNFSGGIQISTFAASLGRRLKFPDDFFTMVNSISYSLYNLDNYTRFGGGFKDGLANSLTFNTTIARNAVGDNPNYPTYGSSMVLTMNFTPPYSAMGAKQSTANPYKLVEYHKWMFDNTWYLKLAGNLVMATRTHFGFIGSYTNRAQKTPFERFILGGSGLTQTGNFFLGQEIIGLRGYDDRSVTPTNVGGLGGIAFSKYVLELRYPISLNPTATLYGLAFAEGGNNWSKVSEFNPFSLKRSAGIGARIFMPAFGMLGVDWAYGFDPIRGTPNASGSQFHFMIGQQLR